MHFRSLLKDHKQSLFCLARRACNKKKREKRRKCCETSILKWLSYTLNRPEENNKIINIKVFMTQILGLQTLSIQRIKSEFPSFKNCYLFLLFIQWVCVNMDISQQKHKKVCSGATNKAIFILGRYSRGLVTSILLW